MSKRFWSIKVKIKLENLGIVTTHEERTEIRRLLCERIGTFSPDQAIDMVSEEEFEEIVKEAKRIAEEKKSKGKRRYQETFKNAP